MIKMAFKNKMCLTEGKLIKNNSWINVRGKGGACGPEIKSLTIFLAGKINSFLTPLQGFPSKPYRLSVLKGKNLPYYLQNGLDVLFLIFCADNIYLCS